MNTQSDFYQHDKRWESQLNALEEKYRRALGAQEESWQKRVQEMERRNELERTWLQKEGEWRQRTDTLQDENQRLNKELQGNFGGPRAGNRTESRFRFGAGVSPFGTVSYRKPPTGGVGVFPFLPMCSHSKKADNCDPILTQDVFPF
ncbi:hypothetical protein D9C73_000107 [Collichthys lucidus]|uniref:Uncharacterized protein n=1 Tax=Collichthys lucidus TaxID=240159 RepID=A0A4U5TYR2_COLLU|nr:hypothetical protein D9C73_000107 [Collichthys lucidus]